MTIFVETGDGGRQVHLTYLLCKHWSGISFHVLYKKLFH